MSDTVTIVIVLAALGAVLLAASAPVSVVLVRLRAHRLPTALALRMEEEWLSELNSISSRPGKLAFAAALILTRRRAFVASGEVKEKDLERAFLQGRKKPTAGGMVALDHEMLVSSYRAMFAKHQDVQMASSLQSARFTVVDPPQLGREVVPNRAAFAGVGAFIGFAMGGTAVFGLSRRQRRLLASRS